MIILLAENQDRVVSKAELVEHVWKNRAISDSTISSAVSYARKALSRAGSKKTFIRTVHGRGFRFVEPVTWKTEVDQADEAPAKVSLPSIAVLPFHDVSNDPDLQGLADGITLDVTALIARIRWLRVVPGRSAFQFRNSSFAVREIGEKLDARYLVEGSFRQVGDRLRITAALVDVAEERQLFVEQFSPSLEELADVQDVIANRIAAMVEADLALAEANRGRTRGTSNLDVWELFHGSHSGLHSFDPELLDRARQRLGQLLHLEPDFPGAHARLACVEVERFWFLPRPERQQILAQAEELANEAIRRDDRDAFGYLALGSAHAFSGRHHDAVAAFEDAILHHPCHAQPRFAMGKTLFFMNELDRGIEQIDRARRWSPNAPYLSSALSFRGIALVMLGAKDEAVHSTKLATRDPRATRWAYGMHAAVLALAGQPREIGACLAKLAMLDPNYSVTTAAEEFSFLADCSFVDAYLEGLTRAGLPQ
ncbi:winged helix-turn-helix domain-containing protein [Pseudoruegeria sp. HB172150]|uniref:winged helix-turn-helix domain-containing tetratricopeptide repeat protein n=1 Tax=Pseudoruegeria sp. HB172150 TaxID=2721164 RepID=UPI0020A65A15|nr:winged helix-turn-helix domain-containing protein [Pseudoruegeria sp. HB172150]